MKSIWTVEFWKDAGERVVSTGIQMLATMIIVTGFQLDDLMGVELWKIVGTMTIVSLAKVVLSGLKGGNPSLVSSIDPAEATKAIAIGKQVLDGDAVLTDAPTAAAELADAEGSALVGEAGPDFSADSEDDGPRHSL